MVIGVSIVEDDAQTREILAGWITKETGFALAGECRDAESALSQLPQRKPDVVLMDINLPGASGVDAVKQLKKILPATQFIMITVYEDTDHIYDALAAGATGYLLKNTPREELLRAVKEVHGGGSPMNCRIARKVTQFFRKSAPSTPADETLSAREYEVLDLLARGYLYKEVADKLKLSVASVNTFVRRAYEKLHVRSRAQAIAKFTQLHTPDQRPRRANHV